MACSKSRFTLETADIPAKSETDPNGVSFPKILIERLDDTLVLQASFHVNVIDFALPNDSKVTKPGL